jgi:thioester reductase-like protein
MSEFQAQKSILLTGSTGNFGKFLAIDLLKEQNVNLTLLVRGVTDEEARGRASEIINLAPDRIKVYKSDLTKTDLDLSADHYSELAAYTTHILHSAASTRFNLSLEEARLGNVIATKNVLTLANKCSKLVRFGFLSSALIAGRRSGEIKEDEFEHDSGFNNTYQQTKYEAEALVRSEASKFSSVIFRPPFIVSDFSDSGSQKNFLSVLISLIAKGYLPCVPGSAQSTMDIVNGHDAAEIIVNIFLKEKPSYLTYQITNGAAALRIKTLHDLVEKQVGRSIPIEYCGDIETFSKRLNEILIQKPELKEVYKRAETFLLEPAFPKIFDNHHTLAEMGRQTLGEDPAVTLTHMIKKS